MNIDELKAEIEKNNGDLNNLSIEKIQTKEQVDQLMKLLSTGNLKQSEI